MNSVRVFGCVCLTLLVACPRPVSHRVRTEPSAPRQGILNQESQITPAPTLAFVSLSAGAGSTCGILEGGELRCWGDGTLSIPETQGISDAVDVEVGLSRTCVLRTGNRIRCWGRPYPNGPREFEVPAGTRHLAVGQDVCLATNTHVFCGLPENTSPVANLPGPIHALQAGLQTCALHGDGLVSCWRSTAPQAQQVEHLPPSTNLAVGREHTCAVDREGTVRCWGLNRYGQAGQPRTGRAGQRFRTVENPSQVEGLLPTQTLATGGAHTCALSRTGEVSCFGANMHGQLGVEPDPRGTRVPGAVAPHQATPATVALSNVQALDAGTHHTCALSEGEVYCWGLNTQWQLGASPPPADNRPRTVIEVTQARELDLGASYSCARQEDGSVACWGGYLATFDSDLSGHRQHHTNTGQPSPITSLSNAVQVAVGFTHACARNENGRVLCWGRNETSQIAPRRWSDLRSSATRVSGVRNAQDLGAGGFHTCATTPTGLYCWGGIHGEVTGNRRTSRPRRTPGLSPEVASNLVQIAAGPRHSCLLFRDGSVHCWGQNDLGGRIGTDRRLSESPEPVELPGPALEIAVGEYHSCARMAEGGVLCWGAFADRQTAQLTESVSMPTPVPNLFLAQSLRCGGAHCCALVGPDDPEALFEVACWGRSPFGQTGRFADRVESPFVVPLTDPVEVAAGKTHSCARLRSGQVRCWGDNRGAALGDGTLPYRHPPQPVIFARSP